MVLDRKLSKLLSEFFIDISKAWFVASFITAPLSNFDNLTMFLESLTRGLLNVILFMYMAWMLAVDNE